MDITLHNRGLAESRERARALIMAGRVKVDGQVRTKAGSLISPDAEIEITSGIGYVSRGGMKLEMALDAFGIDAAGKVCIDVGASTGGFADCLLKRGAARVYALDVGYGQLHWSLRSDPRVIPMERVNVRYIRLEDLPGKVDLATIDVSFISLELVLPPVKTLLKRDGEVVALIKPQFEAGKGEVGKGGVVRDPAKRQRAVEKIAAFAEGLGFRVMGTVESPEVKPRSNVEYFIHLKLDKDPSN